MISVDEDGAYMTLADFDALPEYSCSLPTGTTIGRRWKRGEPYMEPRSQWYLGEYVPCDQPGRVGICWRQIFIEQGAGKPE